MSMPRQLVLSATERQNLLALPDTTDELIRRYTLSETDLAVVRKHRGSVNRLGFAVQLCYLRYPGIALGVDEPPFPPLLQLVAEQLKVPVSCWDDYGRRDQTRREHLVELQKVFGFKTLSRSHYTQVVSTLTELAMQTDKGIILAESLVEDLRQQSIILPAMYTIERICAEAITLANRRIYATLADPLAANQRQRLDKLLERKDDTNITWLAWLRRSSVKPTARQMLKHIERLKTLQALDLPPGIERQVHQNRLLKIAREGGQMTSADLAKFENKRRYATLVALAVEGRPPSRTKSSICTTELLESFSMLLSINLNSNFRLRVKPLMTKCGYTDVLGKHWSMQSKPAATRLQPSNQLSLGRHSWPASVKRKTWLVPRALISYPGSMTAMSLCIGMRRSF
jgi:TnpA family transposase